MNTNACPTRLRLLAKRLSAAGVVGLAMMATPISTIAVERGSDPSAIARSPASNWVFQIPFEVIDGRIYVQTLVNGRGRFRFAVDTGASGYGRADSILVSALGLEMHAVTRNSDGINTSEDQLTRLDSIALSGLIRKDVEVIARDYSGRKPSNEKFFGILARDFFADGLLTINFASRTLSYSNSLKLSPELPGVVTYSRAFRIPLSIGNLQTIGNLDTGANVSFVLPAAVYAKLGGGPARASGNATLSNTTVSTQEAIVEGPFKSSALILKNQRVRISDRHEEIYIGAHALKDAVVMIDQRAKAVAFCPLNAPSSRASGAQVH